MALTNYTFVKSSMAPQDYKVVSTHANKILGWTILYRLLYSRAPHLGRMNGDVQSDLATVAFKNGEQHDYFHGRILRLQQEIMLSGEIFFPNRLLFQYMNSFSKSYNLRDFIALKMTDLITFLDNNGKSNVYTGGDIRGIYRYLKMIGDLVQPKIFPTLSLSSMYKNNLIIVGIGPVLN